MYWSPSATIFPCLSIQSSVQSKPAIKIFAAAAGLGVSSMARSAPLTMRSFAATINDADESLTSAEKARS